MRQIVILTLALWAVVAVEAGEDGQGKKHGGHGRMKCNGQDPSHEVLRDAFEACKEQMPQMGRGGGKRGKRNEGQGDEGGHEKRMCKFAVFKSCLFEQKGITKNGQFNKDALEETYKALYPGENGEKLGKAFAACATEENLKDIANEDKCVALKPLMHCMWQAKHEVCGGGRGGGQGWGRGGGRGGGGGGRDAAEGGQETKKDDKPTKPSSSEEQ